MEYETIDDTVKDGYRVIVINEERISMANSRELREIFLSELGKKHDLEYCIDFRSKYIDSSGVATLVDFNRKIREKGKRKLSLIIEDKDAKAMFRLTGLDKTFLIYNNQEEFENAEVD